MQCGVHTFSWICTSPSAGHIHKLRPWQDLHRPHPVSFPHHLCARGEGSSKRWAYSHTMPQSLRSDQWLPQGPTEKKQRIPCVDPRPGACFLLPFWPSQCIRSGSLTWTNGNEFQMHFHSEPGLSYPQTVCRHTKCIPLVPQQEHNGERENSLKHWEEENTHKHNRFPVECASVCIPGIGALWRRVCRRTVRTCGHSPRARSPAGCSHTSGRCHPVLEGFRDSRRSTYRKEDTRVDSKINTSQ